MNIINRAIAVFAVAVLVLLPGSSPGSDGTAGASTAPVLLRDHTAATAEAFATKTYHQAWQSVRDNLLWRDRISDWDRWEHRFDGKLKTAADADRAIVQMLSSLNDGYTRFRDSRATADEDKKSDERDIVDVRMLANDVGYIRIRTFGSVHVTGEVEDALRFLAKAKSLIIDLRGNRGGYVDKAFEVFSLLVDEGRFTTLKGIQNGAAFNEELAVSATGLDHIENGKKSWSEARRDNLSSNKKIVVLVDENTASASEMLAGALRDNGRAIIVGAVSFGKGIAQVTAALPLGSVQVTYAKYYLPNGECIHGKGIRPKLVVPALKTADAQLEAAIKEARASR